jgi:preprotein translocase subunit SecD
MQDCFRTIAKWLLPAVFPILCLSGCARFFPARESLVVEVTAKPLPGVMLTPAILASGEQVLRNRAAALGANPTTVGIRRNGNVFTITIPGVTDQARACGLYQTLGHLEFSHLRNVRDNSMPGRNQRPAWIMNASDGVYSFRDARKPASKPITDPLEIRRRVIGTKTRPILSGRDLAPGGVRVQDGQGNTMLIALTLTPQAKERFQQFTRTNINEYLAVTLDDRILTVPLIRAAVPGDVVIPTNFTEIEAQELAGLLNAGELLFRPRVTSMSATARRP